MIETLRCPGRELKFLFPSAAVFTKPLTCVELQVVVDGKTIRVELDRSVIQQLMRKEDLQPEDVRSFLWSERRTLELMIKSHLFAHGIPLARELVLSPDDLETVHLP